MMTSPSWWHHCPVLFVLASSGLSLGLGFLLAASVLFVGPVLVAETLDRGDVRPNPQHFDDLCLGVVSRWDESFFFVVGPLSTLGWWWSKRESLFQEQKRVEMPMWQHRSEKLRARCALLQLIATATAIVVETFSVRLRSDSINSLVIRWSVTGQAI